MSYLFGKGASLRRFVEEELYMELSDALPAAPGACMSVGLLAQWIIWMEERIDVVSIPNYVGAAAHWHRDKNIPKTEWPTEDYRVKDRMEGLKRQHAGEGMARGAKVPISPGLLRAMVEWWKEKREKGEKDDLLSMKQHNLLQVGFFGLLRGKEITGLRIGDVHHSEWGVRLKLRESKGMWARGGQAVKKGAWVMLAKETTSGFRLQADLMEYMEALKRAGFTEEDPLFPKWDTELKKLTKSAMHRGSVTDVIRATLEGLQKMFPEELAFMERKDFAGHSLRRGGLNHGRRAGNSRFMAKMHGSWRSDAIEAYDELQEDEMAAFTARM